MEQDNSPSARWEIENVKPHMRSLRNFHFTDSTSNTIQCARPSFLRSTQ